MVITVSMDQYFKIIIPPKCINVLMLFFPSREMSLPSCMYFYMSKLSLSKMSFKSTLNNSKEILTIK